VKGLHDFLGDFMLLNELDLAGLRFFFPMLVFFVHGFNIICHEINGFAERVGGLAEDLDSFFHEFDILLSKCTS